MLKQTKQRSHDKERSGETAHVYEKSPHCDPVNHWLISELFLNIPWREFLGWLPFFVHSHLSISNPNITETA